MKFLICPMTTTPIYSLRVLEVYEALETSAKGLTTAEIETRLSLYGHNLLSQEKKTPLWEKLFHELVHPPALVLMIAGLIALLQGEWILAGIIWSIIVVNMVLSLWREHRAEQAIEKLREILPSFAHVVREGVENYIPSSSIVPGDVLVLAEGDNIPADARVIEEYGLRTNNATLTGEAIPARKTADSSHQTGISELDRPNLIFAGTSIASGTGRAVVYSTGMMTQFGRIAHLTQSIAEEPTPFQKELNKLSKVSAWVALLIGGIVAAVGYFSLGFPIREVTLLALGIVVAVIPEGLVATLTLSLAVAVQRLAQRGVLAKKLSTVERLGLVSVICTDKSGTLTQNQMTVRDIWVARRRIKVTGVGYEPQGSFSPDPKGQSWEKDLLCLLEVAASCNNARINAPSAEHPMWTSLGDQTEAAMKVAAMKAGILEAALNQIIPRVHELPFDARRKRMTTIHRETNQEIAFVKGAPREVLQLCTKIFMNGVAVTLTNELRTEILNVNDDYARGALRVLALARRDLPPRSGSYTSENIECELTFMGLMAMMDPPRPQVEKAIQTCRQANIRIVMITGDYGLTAESLARRVGMLTTKNSIILTGAELDELSDVALQELLDKEVLFARMAPEHKMRLVSAFQQRGEVVAVTGDGVNDAPALRKADVGISMGIVGTDVAKEAADIILTQDDFGAITTAIEEGRGVYDNIRKFITYIFSSNIPELMPFIVKANFPLIPLALSVRQILAIDLGTDMFPALALGMEKPEPDVMNRPPRPRNQPLIDSGLLWRAFGWLGLMEAALCFAGFLTVFVLTGHTAEIGLPFLAGLSIPTNWRFSLPFNQTILLATTVYHAGVVTAQIGNVLACRSDRMRNSSLGWLSNKYLWLGIIIELLGITGMIYIPFLAKVFNHVSLPIWMWGGLAMNALVIYSVEWVRKLIKRGIQKYRTEKPSRLTLQEVV
ncbi:MAG: cation-transporting P-type ATPase [Chloroflexi bacterium]|nr:cation-transporting P-type ATPase [Chloroflexota bacterium]